MKNRIELAKYFGELGFKTGAEIGVYMARYSEILFQNIPSLKLYCVDSWENIPHHTHIADAGKAKLANYNSVVIHKTSMEAIREFDDESLDFVYIDANHGYLSVRDDITAWAKKVRKGGIVAGDDYYLMRSGNDGVIKAVDEYVKIHGYNLNITDWDNRNPITDDRQPNWWFVK
jgi:predicted O-methyltransferase YrrM